LSVLGLVMLKVCCSSLERSIAFYEALGFKVAGPAKVGAGWVGPLYGIAGGTPRAQAMSRPDDPKAVSLELIEWTPNAPGAPHPNTIGAGMVGFRSNDLDADCAALQAAGGELISEPVSTPGPADRTIRMANLRDPDGFNIQLVQFVKAAAPA